MKFLLQSDKNEAEKKHTKFEFCGIFKSKKEESYPLLPSPILKGAGGLTNQVSQQKEFQAGEAIAFTVLAFFGISNPQMEVNYRKIGEMLVYKFSQGRANDTATMRCVKRSFKHWQKRWMVIGPNSIWYYKRATHSSYDIRDFV